MFYSPERTKKKDLEVNFRYWRKFELIEFCKENDLITGGNKIQLKERIENHLKGKSRKESLKNKSRTIKKSVI